MAGFDEVDAMVGRVLYRMHFDKPFEKLPEAVQDQYIRSGQRFREHLAAAGYRVVRE